MAASCKMPAEIGLGTSANDIIGDKEALARDSWTRQVYFESYVSVDTSL